MKSPQVTQEQLHVLEQFLAADLPAATPAGNVLFNIFQQWHFLVELEDVGSIEQPRNRKMERFLLGSSVPQLYGQPVASRCSCSLK